MSKIIVDSCCDLTPELREEMGITSVPLTMMVGDKEFRDDDTLDMADYMESVKNYSGKSASAAPSPFLYQEAIENAGDDDIYIVTLSDNLSSSHSNAVVASEQATTDGKDAACVFDSKSASAGETLIAIKIHELIQAGMPKNELIETVKRFISKLKTYFVLENYDTLKKNGRLSKVTGLLIQILGIKLIMGADTNGDIALFEKCRGAKKMLQQLLARIENSGKEIKNENIVISHCNNPGLAGELAGLIKAKFDFKKIYIVPTGGLSSLYADDQGIVMAF